MIASRTSTLNRLLLKVPPKKVFQRFIVLFLPLLIFSLLGFSYLKYQSNMQRISIRLTEEKERINLAQNMLIRDLEILGSDLNLLSSSDEFTTFFQHNDKEAFNRLKRRFLLFSHDRKMYDQIRYIDEKGMEIIRINRRSDISYEVSNEKLQNKGDRYYFLETMQLPPGTLYMSPFDLNIEHGEIEKPLKPVIRIATHLVDQNGNKRGILIFNYLANTMLIRFRASLPQNTTDVTYSLINDDGWWLSHPDKTKEWGFQLNHRKSFFNEFPESWELIEYSKHGQFKNQSGVFTYTRVNPHKELTNGMNSNNAHKISQQTDYWFLLSLITNKSANYFSQPLFHTFLFFIMIAAGITWRFAQTSAIKRRWEALTSVLFFAIDQSPAAVILTDRDGNIEYVNERFCSVTGYTKDSVIGQNPRVLKSEDSVSDSKSLNEYEELWSTIISGKTWKGEFHNKRKDGTSYWAKAEISPVINNRGVIQHFIGIQEDITEQRKLSAQLKEMACTDPLTGLYNRRHLDIEAKKEMVRCRRNNSDLAVLILDIDYFKAINDKWGHGFGDFVLMEFATFLRKSIRENDILARIGGEEFVALFPGMTSTDAQFFAERLRSGVADLSLCKDDVSINITVSIGCTQWTDKDKAIKQTIHRADEALYRAKKAGRNKVYASEHSNTSI